MKVNILVIAGALMVLLLAGCTLFVRESPTTPSGNVVVNVQENKTSPTVVVNNPAPRPTYVNQTTIINNPPPPSPGPTYVNQTTIINNYNTSK